MKLKEIYNILTDELDKLEKRKDFLISVLTIILFFGVVIAFLILVEQRISSLYYGGVLFIFGVLFLIYINYQYELIRQKRIELLIRGVINEINKKGKSFFRQAKRK